MFNEQPRRKPRIPLSKEEVYYFKQIKNLKQLQKLEAFKATFFYKSINTINILLMGLLTYCLLSILMVSFWQKTYVAHVISTYGETNLETKQRSISELQLKTTSGEAIILKTSDLLEPPKINQALFIGKDYLFHKTLKVKFIFDERIFWQINAYASLTVCVFALAFGCFIYKINKHLTTNGLLVVFGLFSLACLYFILI